MLLFHSWCSIFICVTKQMHKYRQPEYRYDCKIMTIQYLPVSQEDVKLNLSWFLQEHMAKHQGDKPYKCEVCPKQFNHKTDLRRHMCLHTGEKPFACDVCGKGFIREDRMVKHSDTHKKKQPILMTWQQMDSSVPSCWRSIEQPPPRPPEAVPVNVGGCYWSQATEATAHPPPPAHAHAAAAASAAAVGTSNFFWLPLLLLLCC